jgi:hypothetical protein
VTTVLRLLPVPRMPRKNKDSPSRRKSRAGHDTVLLIPTPLSALLDDRTFLNTVPVMKRLLSPNNALRHLTADLQMPMPIKHLLGRPVNQSEEAR